MPGASVGVDVASRGGGGDQREVGAADPLAALQFVAGHADVIGRGGPTQADLRPTEHIARETAWHRWQGIVGGEAVCGRIGGRSGPSNEVRLVASIGPGGKVIGGASQGLGCGGTDGVRGSQDDRSRKGGGSAATADDQLQARRRGRKVQCDRLRIKEDTLGVRQARRIRHRQFDLEVRRVFMIRRRKGCRRDAGETLNGVRVTVRGTMMQDNLPRKRRGRERTLVRIGGVSGECNRLADLPLSARRRRINKCCGAPCLDRDAFDVRLLHDCLSL